MKVVKGVSRRQDSSRSLRERSGRFLQCLLLVAGVEGVSKDAVKQAAKSNQNLLQRAVAAIARSLRL